MTRINYDDQQPKILKQIPAVRVERCPLASSSNLYEHYGQSLVRKRNPQTKFGVNELQNFIDVTIESEILVGSNGEPCYGKVCDYYGGDGEKALICKWPIWKKMKEEGITDLKELIKNNEKNYSGHSPSSQ
jgi:hypothetical protein